MIWSLLIFGILLIVLNIRALKKGKSSFDFVLNSKEENMEEVDFKLGELRREFSETILELQKEIEILKGTYINNMDEFHKEVSKAAKDNFEKDEKYVNINLSTEAENTQFIDIKEENVVKQSKDTKKNNTDGKVSKGSKNDTNNVRIEEINKLLNEGLSIEEISRRLGIGKGEVLLIKELYLR